jgi:hypothetical protein
MLTPQTKARIAKAEAYLRMNEKRDAEIAVLTARVATLTEALEMIAGRRQCLDNLMSNVTIAEAALDANEQTVGDIK